MTVDNPRDRTRELSPEPPSTLPLRLPLRRWRRYLAQSGDPDRRSARLLLAMQALYVLVFVGVFLFGSNAWPAAPDLIVLGLLGFAVITGRGLPFLRDWTPFLVLVLAYIALPGLAPGLEQRVHIGLPIAVDRWLGRGQLPTLRLQALLWDPDRIHWYDYL